MNAVAIIPARGGSKRYPRKNVADFLGRPIIAYTIEAAVQSGCFGRVVVSTEDDEITAIAGQYGAIVDKRPAVLATDAATLLEVCLDFLDRESKSGRNWETMACLLATAPMRNALDIRNTFSLIKSGRCGSAVAITTFDHSPYHALKLGPDGTLSPMWPDSSSRRVGELPALRAGNGSTYIVDVAQFRRLRSFYGPGLRGYEMPPERSIDIDTRADLDRAQVIARAAQGDEAGRS